MTPPDAASRPTAAAAKWWKFPLALALSAYFLCFNWGSLRVHFAADDLANMGHYFEYSPWQLVLSNFLPWRGDYRPMGGLFYMAVYHFAGLDPVPYQAVLLAILLANVWFAYRAVRLLGGSELAASLVALACCYHGGIANLYYNAAFVYDALCCCLYLATLVYYLRIRESGRRLGAGESVAFLGIFLCALNSKEMAVSVPVMLLVYEWMYHPPDQWNRASLTAWVRGPARLVWIAAVLTVVDIYGKVAGSTAMVRAEGYHPVFTSARALAFQVALFQDLFFSRGWTPGWGPIAGFYAVLAWLAWRRPDRPILRFLFCYLLVVPLPLEFLPGKREACFALLMVGGGAFLAVIFADAVESATNYLGREFQLPAAGRHLLFGSMVAIAVVIWVRDQRQLRLDVGKDPMTSLGAERWDIVQQMRASSFHPLPGTRVAFVDDPFHSLDMYFLARLWFHDRSIEVHVSSQGPLSPAELARTDYVFTIDNRQVIRIK